MPPTSRPSTAARRTTAAVCAMITIAAGLIVHSRVPGDPGDIIADALYAVLIYLLAVLVAPRVSRRVLAALALAFCFGVELLQLTDIPADVNRAFSPAALILGHGFDQRDLLVYLVAILMTLAVDIAITRRLRRS